MNVHATPLHYAICTKSNFWYGEGQLGVVWYHSDGFKSDEVQRGHELKVTLITPALVM